MELSRLSLRKLKIHEDMSEETTCFSAELLLDGRMIAYVKNDGHGGCTDIHTYDLGTRDKITELEEWAKNLPEKPLDMGGGRISSYRQRYRQSLDSIVDDLVADVEVYKKIHRASKRCIVFGNFHGSELREVSWKGLTIEQMKQYHPQLLRDAIAKIRVDLGDDETILNKNLEGFL